MYKTTAFKVVCNKQWGEELFIQKEIFEWILAHENVMIISHSVTFIKEDTDKQGCYLVVIIYKE